MSQRHPPPPFVGEMEPAGPHSYPADVVRIVMNRWAEEVRADRAQRSPMAALIPEPLLRSLLSTCYQASLLTDEGRPATFRVVVGDPAWLHPDAAPPTGLFRLVFDHARPFDAQELRRVVPAAGFSRSLIGVHADRDALRVWGLVNSGPRWLQPVHGNHATDPGVPPLLTVAVTGPGRLAISRGTASLAELFGGSLRHDALDVFQAPWLRRALSDRAQSPVDPAEPGLPTSLREHALRRIVATLRETRHGGILFLLPPDHVPTLDRPSSPLRLKYRFADEEPRRRIETLIDRIVKQRGERRPIAGEPTSRNGEEAASAGAEQVDEALLEITHFVAGMGNVDGAVALTTHLEVLGFGAEVSGSLPDVERVAHAQDLAGDCCSYEPTDSFGMRHRAAFRLCEHLPAAVAVVLSQDGSVRFVQRTATAVTYWDQLATRPWET